jgi:hypothetical protein
MSRQPPLKVYGHLYPVPEALYLALQAICALALPASDDVPVLERDGDMARFSFEGVYFPCDELLACLSDRLQPVQRGKLDVLDLDNWHMTRHVFQDGQVQSQRVSLNHVLDYSGF